MEAKEQDEKERQRVCYNKMTGETNMIILIKSIEFKQKHDCDNINEADTIKDPFIRFTHIN